MPPHIPAEPPLLIGSQEKTPTSKGFTCVSAQIEKTQPDSVHPPRSLRWYVITQSIVRLRERASKARSADDLDVSIGHEISNIFSRIWTPSKPVLHLAIALRADVEEIYPGEAQWGKQLSMLANPSWVVDCIRRAEVFRTVHALRIPPLRILPHRMIQVLPAKP